MRKDGHPEVQHYVPQLLLRLHVNDPSARRGLEQVWCFDKKTDNVFSPNIKGILASTRFYEMEIDDEWVSFETSLTAIEDRTAPILNRLVQTRRLREISHLERKTLAEFCAVQFVRTPGLREQIKNTNEGVLKALQTRGFRADQLSTFRVPSEEEIKVLSLQMLADAPATYGPHFLSKHWHLIEARDDDPFHLGDHPVVVDNDFAPAGTGIGLASPGSTAYLPLCPTLSLGMTDPQVVAYILRNGRRINRNFNKWEKKASRLKLTGKDLDVLQQLKEDRDKGNELYYPFRNGTPTPYDHRVVMRVNSLQMIYANRWIISSKPDFSLPKIMINDNEKFRKGPEIKVV